MIDPIQLIASSIADKQERACLVGDNVVDLVRQSLVRFAPSDQQLSLVKARFAKPHRIKARRRYGGAACRLAGLGVS